MRIFRNLSEFVNKSSRNKIYYFVISYKKDKLNESIQFRINDDKLIIIKNNGLDCLSFDGTINDNNEIKHVKINITDYTSEYSEIYPLTIRIKLRNDILDITYIDIDEDCFIVESNSQIG